MLLPPAALRRILLLPVLLGLLCAAARADLVWNQQGGWRVEGGALSGLTGTEGRTALDLMNQARQAEEAHSYRAALSAYTKVTKKYPTSIYAPEAYYHTAKIYEAKKQYFKAFDAYQQILGRYPNVKRFNQLIENQFRIASFLLDGGRSRIWGIFPGFVNREKAVQYMAVIVSEAPYSDYAPLALMECARGQIYLGQSEEAIDTLDRMVNSYGQSVLSPEAYLRLSKLHASLVEGPYYDQAETKQAISYNEDFMILFPNDPKIADAAQGLDSMKKMLALSKMKIGDFYFLNRDNYTAARVFYNEAITSYPDSDVAKQARQRLNQVEAKAKAATEGGGQPKPKHFLFF